MSRPEYIAEVRVQAPLLRELTLDAWLAFDSDYKAWSARGGAKPAGALLADTTMDMLNMTYPIELPDVASIVKLSRDELFVFIKRELRVGVTMPKALIILNTMTNASASKLHSSQAVNYNGVIEYVMAFRRWQNIFGDLFQTELADQELASTFVRRLAPPLFRQGVELERTAKTLVATMNTTLDVARRARLQQEFLATPGRRDVGQEHNKEDKPKDDKAKADKAKVDNKGKAGDKPKDDKAGRACFLCHKHGHNAADCPEKPKDDPKARAAAVEAKEKLKKMSAIKDVAAAQSPDVDAAVLVRLDDNLDAQALLDSGSDFDCVSQNIYQRLKASPSGVRVRSAQQQVLLGDGSLLTVSEAITITATIQVRGRSVRFTRDYLVFPTLADKDVIIGIKTMRDVGLIILLERDEALVREIPEEAFFPELEPELVARTSQASPIPDELQQRVAALVDSYADLFDNDLSVPANLPAFRVIPKKDAKWPRVLPRQLSPIREEALNSIIDEGVAMGHYIFTTAPASAAPVLVKKPNGDFRLALDYRAVNLVTEDEHFPLNDMQTVMAHLAGHKYFAKIDLKDAFHQVELESDSQRLLTIATPRGNYMPTRMGQGLKNAASHFSHGITTAMQQLPPKTATNFQDDIIALGKDEDSFLDHLTTLLGWARANRIKLSRKKSIFLATEVLFVGHLVDANTIRQDPARIQAVLGMAVPTDTSTARSLLGVLNYFRRFIPNYADIVQPITRLTSSRVPFQWATEQQDAFDKIMTAIQRCQPLYHVQYDKSLYIRTDASRRGAGAVLFQYDEDNETCVIAFASKQFTNTMAAWTTIEQEAFAIVFALHTFEQYLLGYKFTLQTDHRNLTFIYRAASDKVLRWQLYMSGFDFSIEHIPGADNKIADGLSRLFALRAASNVQQADQVDDVDIDEDYDLLAFVDDVEDVQSGSTTEEEEEELIQPVPPLVPVLPNDNSILLSVHNHAVGHRGVEPTLRLLAIKGYTDGAWRAKVKHFIDSCGICQKLRSGGIKPIAALKTTMTSRPFDTIAIDTAGPLPIDDSGNMYIIVSIDIFSRWIELKAAPSTSAEDAATALLHVVGRFGVPRMIHSDKGPQFNNSLISHLVAFLEFKQQFTLPYRPQANGVVERAIAEVMKHLRAIIYDKRVSFTWSLHLPVVQRIINSSYHSAIGTSPAQILFPGVLDLDRGLLSLQEEDKSATNVHQYVLQVEQAFNHIIEISEKHQQQVIQQYLSKSPEAVGLEIGQHVLLQYPNRPPSKLATRWFGPLTIIDKMGDNEYSLLNPVTKQVSQVHATRIKLFKNDVNRLSLDLLAEDYKEFIVSHIVEHEGQSKKDARFRVRWEGFDESDDSWEPYSVLRDTEALQLYLSKNNIKLH